MHFLQAVTDDQKQIAEKHAKDCLTETSYTPEELAKLRANPKAAVGDVKAQVSHCHYTYNSAGLPGFCWQLILIWHFVIFFSSFFQKFGKCFLHKLGFINDAGELQEQVVIEKMSKGGDRAKIEEIVKGCKSVLGTNKDENPIKLYACYLEKKALAA